MGDIQIMIVVADDPLFVEHPGNAERPHAAVNRPISSLHRPSVRSRSFVRASLRALHLDQPCGPELKATRALTAAPLTGNARLTGSRRVLDVSLHGARWRPIMRARNPLVRAVNALDLVPFTGPHKHAHLRAAGCHQAPD